MELIVVLVIALVILGPKRLPDVGKSIGKGLREFKDGVGGLTGGDDDGHTQLAAAVRDEPRPAPRPANDKVETPVS
jgi:sec-independent protein translocase protein TatA